MTTKTAKKKAVRELTRLRSGARAKVADRLGRCCRCCRCCRCW
ncbi:MAG TPA: hypothetical protein VFB96_24275 [Pirellulaceae bacterium]|nr:hypothetical protein [Pirellulaceae bacterium]